MTHKSTCLPLCALLFGLLAAPGFSQESTGTLKAKPIEIEGETFEPENPDASSDDTLFDFANMLYSRKRYQDAVQKYTAYLQASPSGVSSDAAWFRLGESYRNLDRPKEAAQCFDALLKQSPEGPFAGSAAFIMAVLKYNQDEFEQALPYFETAATKLDKDELKVQARFFYARALQALERYDESAEKYESVLENAGSGEYGERARLELARIALNKGDKEKALELFDKLAESAKNESYKEEARMRAALLSMELENPEKAQEMLMETLKSSDNPEFRAQAQMALMYQAYEKQEYEKVLEAYGAAKLEAEGETMAQLLLIAAHAYRHLEKYANAIEIYGTIERIYRDLPESTEAGYRKLQCMHLVGDEDLASSVDRYVAQQRSKDASSEFIDLALLLKGESLFAQKDYAAAAEAYKQVRSDKIPEQYVATRLYKMGWALAECGKGVESADALGKFISIATESPLIPSALAKRAVTLQSMQDYEAALRDYRRLTANHPESQHAEFALQQIALIHAHKREVDQMVEAYQKLLARFPETEAAAEANYWIGGGLFEQKKYEESIEPLDKARKMAPDKYFGKATLRLILAYYHLDKTDELFAETSAILDGEADVEIPVQVFANLGRSLYDDGEYQKAERFLVLTSDPEDPKNTPPDVWEKLANIHMRSGEHQQAISDWDNYLIHQTHPEKRATAMLEQAESHMKLKQPDEAERIAREVLNLVHQGRTNALARELMGDIEMMKGNPSEATKHYVVLVELFNDEVIKPRALSKLVNALDSSGKKLQAIKYRRQLSKEFPNYQP